MKRIKISEKCNQVRILISYADEAYYKAQELQTRTAKIAGFSEVIEYGPEDIEDTFRKEHKDIFDIKRGNGLWLWKPYLIKKTLDEMEDGDILFYCDSGACFFRRIEGILSKLEMQDIWVSVLPLKEKQFTKKDTFKLLDCNTAYYKETAQISGTFCAFRKSKQSIEFVNEWLYWCCCIKALETPVNREKEEDFFYAHREDQSILSLLIKKYKVRAWSDPSQYGRLPEKYIRPGCEMVYYGNCIGQEDYPVCILHHRTKDGNKKVLFSQLMCALLPRWLGKKFISNGNRKSL